MRRPDLLILVAIWEFIAAFLAFLLLAGMLFFSFFVAVNRTSAGPGFNQPPATFFLGLSILFIIFLILYIVISIAGGIGLLRGREWARITSIVQAAMSLLGFPVFTVIGVLAIIYLTRPEVRSYFVRPLAPPPFPPEPPVVPPPGTPPERPLT